MPRTSVAVLTPHALRAVAVAAGCDPRTVRAYLAGRPTTSTTSARVEEALRAHGRADLVRPTPEAQGEP